MSDQPLPPNDCGCCQDPTPLTPASHANPIGQSSLAYRAGTHGSFKAAMKAALSRQEALQGLTTRSDDDPAIALLDTAALVLDVLTFYQERIANEGYLRTAAERLSILELARSIGYQLRPGVAAGAHLAFNLDATSAPGSINSLQLDPGVRAQSVPGPGELPQTFETSEKIEARPEWNSLSPRLTVPYQAKKDSLEITLLGINTGLKPGDAVLIAGQERRDNPASEAWDFRRVRSVEPDPARNLTRVTWDKGLGWEKPPFIVYPAGKNVRAYALRQRASLFGYNAPDWRALPDPVKCGYLGKNSNCTPSSNELKQWPNFDLDTSKLEIDLDTVYPQVIAGSWLVLSIPGYQELYSVASAVESAQASFGISARASHLALQGENFNLYAAKRRETTVFAQSEELPIAESPLVEIDPTAPSRFLTLETGALTPLEGALIIFDRQVQPFLRGRYLAVSGRRMRVRVLAEQLTLAAANGITKPVKQSANLVLLDAPLSLDGGLTRLHLLDQAGFDGFASVSSVQAQLSPSLPTDPTVSEVVQVQDCGLAKDETATQVELQHALKYSYDRATATIRGNVAPATQGETRREVLGSSDASQAFQSFTLRQKPLTYVSADTPSGSSSTLQLRVGDILWEEAGSLYNLGPSDRVYTVSLDDDGKAAIQFGDGLTGARPPSGSENVTATYRVGSGQAGNVQAGQISNLMTRPLGLKEVTNPAAASGGDNPEPRDQARRNAPLTTLTLGRLVSLKDYEDFVRAFSGIAKAQAAWLWDGGQRSVYLTISGPSGAAVASDSKVYENLVKAIARYGLPYQPFQVASYTPLVFRLHARVQVDPLRTADLVLKAARQAVLDAFSFDAREFARGVTASQVSACIQAVPGILMVDLDSLYLAGQTPSTALPLPPLPAGPAFRDASGVIHPAELLTVDETRIEIVNASA